jgi:hypothetical protein
MSDKQTFLILPGAVSAIVGLWAWDRSRSDDDEEDGDDWLPEPKVAVDPNLMQQAAKTPVEFPPNPVAPNRTHVEYER